jgi:type I restriction enzyme S subunit
MTIQKQIWTLDELVLENRIKLGRGDVISKKDIASNPGNFPIYSSAQEKNGVFGFYGKYMFDEELITWSVDGGGKLFYRPKHKFSVTNVGGTLKILEPSFLNIRYLYFVLTYLHSKIKFDWVFKAHPSVLRKVYNTIPIPDLNSQLKLVDKFDKAFVEIDSLEKNLQLKEEKTNQLLQSMLNAALNNDKFKKKVVTLDQISENLDSQRIPITREVRTAGKYPYYGASGIIDYVEDYIFEGDALLVSEDGANLLARSTPIAFSVTGKYWVNNHAHIMRFTDQDLQEYVKYYLENTNLDKYITGAAQPKLTQRALNSIPIKIPVNKLDTKSVSETLSSLKELTFLIFENNIRRKKLTDELKSSFLSKYLSQKAV